MGAHARQRPRRRGDFVRAAALLTAATVAAAMTFPAQAAALRAPRPAVRLPAAAEALAPYTPQATCDPAPKPGVSAFRALMLLTYRRGYDGGISRACDAGASSEHKEGRAWDWMLDISNSADRLAAQSALSFLLAPGPHGELAWNARRFGVMYIIWDRHIWSSYRAAEGWRGYAGPNAHTDHIHLSFSWAGSMKRTSWWTGKVAVTDYGPCQTVIGVLARPYHFINTAPCAAPRAAVASVPAFAGPGSSGARVLQIQRALKVYPASGYYGPVTARAVLLYQRTHRGFFHTGVVDVRTAVGLGLLPRTALPAAPAAHGSAAFLQPGAHGPAVVALQKALRIRPATGFFGAFTLRTVKAFQARAHAPATGVVTVAQAAALRLPGVPPIARPVALALYVGPGAHGPRVLAVQRALHIRPSSGFYGPVTTRAVRAFQGRHRGLPHTGIVDVVTARSLGIG